MSFKKDDKVTFVIEDIVTNGLFQQMVDRVPHKAFFLSFSSFLGEKKVPLLRNVRPSGLGTEKPPRACFLSRKKEALSRHPDYTGCGGGFQCFFA